MNFLNGDIIWGKNFLLVDDDQSFYYFRFMEN